MRQEPWTWWQGREISLLEFSIGCECDQVLLVRSLPPRSGGLGTMGEVALHRHTLVNITSTTCASFWTCHSLESTLYNQDTQGSLGGYSSIDMNLLPW